MPCRRCGSDLAHYELAGRTASVCPECGFVNVPVSHETEPDPDESWVEAFERFYTKFGDDGDAETDAADGEAESHDSDGDATDESDDEATDGDDADASDEEDDADADTDAEQSEAADAADGEDAAEAERSADSST